MVVSRIRGKAASLACYGELLKRLKRAGCYLARSNTRRMGSNPILSFRQGSSKRGQLVDASKRSACAERLADNQEAGGSNPSLVV